MWVFVQLIDHARDACVLTNLFELAQLLWQLLDAVAVQVQPIEAGQASNAGRHLCQFVL